MSDLIERLRGPSPSIPAMRDAADEIERLRDLVAGFDDGGHWYSQQTMDAVVRECDELRRQLDEPKRAETCLWSRADDDTDTWETACRHAFTIIDGTPTDNQMAFCCYCGRPVEQEIGGSDAE